MNLHEYQARELLKAAGVAMFDGDVAATPSEAEAIARKFGGMVVVKAQVHSGGRGKAGGVKLAKTPEEAREHASKILGMQIKGLTVEKVLVTTAEDIATEGYVGVLMDRKKQAPDLHGLRRGRRGHRGGRGQPPEAIRKLAVDPRYGLLPHQALWLANALYDDPEPSSRRRRSSDSSTRRSWIGAPWRRSTRSSRRRPVR